jgi:hypothetical protein
VYINNSVVANAFNDEMKNQHLQAENLEQQAEIFLKQNPYLLIQQTFDKSATRLQKTS